MMHGPIHIKKTAFYICLAYLKLEYKGLDWVHLIQDRDKWRAFAQTLMNHWVPQIAGKFLTRWVTVSFWIMTPIQGVRLIVRDSEVMGSCIIIIIIITFMNKKTKNTFLIDIAVPNTHNLAETVADKTKQVPRTGEWNMCCVEAKGSTRDPDSNIIYGSNSKVTITKSNKT